MKNVLIVVFFIIGLVLFVQFIQAQTVDEIINKYMDARGGKERLMAITSLYMEGSKQMMGNEIPIKITKVQGKLSRTEFEAMGQTGYTIVTPEKGWMFIPMRSQSVDPIPAERLKAMQGDLDIPGALVDYKAKGSKAELIGKDSVNGAEAYKIKLTNAAGKETTYYIDAKTYLVTEISQMAGGMGGDQKPHEVTTYLTDYKQVDGIMFPMTINVPGGGMMGGSTTFDKVEVNKPVDEKLYKP
jgi:regulatory protein YycI of two-component signal transduction system YycFG